MVVVNPWTSQCAALRPQLHGTSIAATASLNNPHVTWLRPPWWLRRKAVGGRTLPCPRIPGGLCHPALVERTGCYVRVGVLEGSA